MEVWAAGYLKSTRDLNDGLCRSDFFFQLFEEVVQENAAGRSISDMLVAMLSWFLIASSLASGGDFGRNFAVSFEDRDGMFEQEAPTLWIVSTDGGSFRVGLRDDGGAGDAEEGDSIFSATVGELPGSSVLLVVDGPSGEIWREADFSIPGDMEYPALRLSLASGLVEGGLQQDLSPKEQRAAALEGHAPNRGVQGELQSMMKDKDGRISLLVLALLVGLPPLLVIGVRRRQFRLRRRKNWSMALDEVVLGQDLPPLKPGLQVWASKRSATTLREELGGNAERNCELFWLPKNRVYGRDFSGIYTWSGALLSLIEALRWRQNTGSQGRVGPLFVEGVESLHFGYGLDERIWDDLETLAGECPVVILQKDPSASADWALRGLPPEWLAKAVGDRPGT